MKAAGPTDWKTEPLPAKKSTIQLDRTFSPQEMAHIQQGLIPEQMEDKWFIYWQDDNLFFHRSWTGYCIYIVHFTAAGGGSRMVQAEVNRDPDQYREANDEHDVAMISYLIDILLLRQASVFPSAEPSPETRALMNWSQVGRAMFGQHPNDEQEESL